MENTVVWSFSKLCGHLRNQEWSFMKLCGHLWNALFSAFFRKNVNLICAAEFLSKLPEMIFNKLLAVGTINQSTEMRDALLGTF